MNRYQTFASLNRHADVLAFAATAAQAASNKVPLKARAAALSAASAIEVQANNVRNNRDNALKRYQTDRSTVGVFGWGLVIVALLAALGVGVVGPTDSVGRTFLLESGLTCAALVGLGLAMTGRVFGAAIDGRNRISLSKLQMLAWTVLVVGAVGALLSARLHDHTITTPLQPGATTTTQTNPEQTTSSASEAERARTNGNKAKKDEEPPLIPGELLLAMGIAATSFVATPLILSLKAQEQPTQQSIAKLQATRVSDVDPIGKVDTRPDPADASFADIFHGDEVGNANSIDVSKVQQIFITLLLLALYGSAVFVAFEKTLSTIAGLPPLDRDLLKLMAISHASYLGYKAAPKTSSQTAPS